jgi:uracil-DNA glycosylase family 4
MNSPRRKRYLKALGIDVWRQRGATAEADNHAEASADAVAALAPGVTAQATPVVASKPAAAATPRRRPPTPVPDRAPETAPTPTVLVERPPVPADWEGLRAMVKDCTACKLCATRTQTVFGVGNQSAPLMIVGEGPGADEDAQGEPFVGRAGKLLDEMLAAIGRSRGEQDAARAVFIANVVKCRPPGNRDPEADEVEACRPYLDRQIERVQPKLIVALGRVAAQRLLSTDAPLSRLRGPLYHYGPDKTPLLVTYHPAYLLRSPREKAKSWDDLKKIHRYLVQPA